MAAATPCSRAWYAAYDALSPRMKTYLSGLTATTTARASRSRDADLGPSGHHPASGHGQEGYLRQHRLHLENKRAAGARERARLEIFDRSLQQTGMDVPTSLARPFDRILGQIAARTQSDLGLLAERAVRLSHPGWKERRLLNRASGRSRKHPTSDWERASDTSTAFHDGSFDCALLRNRDASPVQEPPFLPPGCDNRTARSANSPDRFVVRAAIVPECDRMGVPAKSHVHSGLLQ